MSYLYRHALENYSKTFATIQARAAFWKDALALMSHLPLTAEIELGDDWLRTMIEGRLLYVTYTGGTTPCKPGEYLATLRGGRLSEPTKKA